LRRGDCVVDGRRERGSPRKPGLQSLGAKATPGEVEPGLREFLDGAIGEHKRNERRKQPTDGGPPCDAGKHRDDNDRQELVCARQCRRDRVDTPFRGREAVAVFSKGLLSLGRPTVRGEEEGMARAIKGRLQAIISNDCSIFRAPSHDPPKEGHDANKHRDRQHRKWHRPRKKSTANEQERDERGETAREKQAWEIGLRNEQAGLLNEHRREPFRADFSATKRLKTATKQPDPKLRLGSDGERPLATNRKRRCKQLA
jgi:hypothetical protein